MDAKLSNKEYKRTLGAYVSGFIMSIALTFAAYVVVQAHTASSNEVLAQPTVLITILFFAVIQLIVQLYYFLHLGEETKPRWRLMTLLMAVSFVLILVIGSIWIMANLDYHMTGSQETIDKYIKTQDDL